MIVLLLANTLLLVIVFSLLAHLAFATKKGRKKMGQDLETLKAEVTACRNVMHGAAVLIGGLASKIETLSHDPAGLLDLVASLREGESELSGAVAANTSADPTAPPPPAPATEPAIGQP